MEKPRQSLWSLITISFGFFGIQAAFGLQNANVSRVFQSLGSDVDKLAILWIAGPVTGLIVQPLIGHASDRNWGRFGRRRPFFFAGAMLVATALLLFPHATSLYFAAALLWMLDASLKLDFDSFFTTNPELIKRGIGLQPEAFKDFHFNKPAKATQP